MKTIERLRELLAKATDAPWGWTTYGDKCNAAFLATFMTCGDECAPIGGRVDRYVWDDRKGEYRTVAMEDEVIATKEDNARFSDFALIAATRNALPALLAVVEAQAAEIRAWRDLWDAMKKDHNGPHTQKLLKKLAAEEKTDAALRALEGGA